MASSVFVKDMKEDFFKCSVCLNDFTEPKILPCVHRYCQQCLQEVIDSTNEAKVTCPLCSREWDKPEEGAAGFETDFHIKSMLEYMQSGGRSQQRNGGNRASPTNNEFPGFHSLSIVLEDIVSAFDIEQIRASGWKVYSITSIIEGRIVLSGRTPDKYSFILVTNMKGEVIRQDKMKGEDMSSWRPSRFCESLSLDKAASVCSTNQIGIYDVRDGSFLKKNISYVTRSWPSDRYLSCVTVDPPTKNIFVGSLSDIGCSREVIAFDTKLTYLYRLVLPEKIRGMMDMTIHRGKLAICDWDGKKAFIVSIERRNATIDHELISPDDLSGDWAPASVCADTSSHLYILWSSNAGRERSIITKYNQESSRILSTKEVVGESQCITVVATEEGDKLLVATRGGKVFISGTG